MRKPWSLRLQCVRALERAIMELKLIDDTLQKVEKQEGGGATNEIRTELGKTGQVFFHVARLLAAQGISGHDEREERKNQKTAALAMAEGQLET